MPQSGYRTVSLPNGLLDAIDKLIERLAKEDLSIYRNRSEFIADAIRDLIAKTNATYLLGVSDEEQ